MNKAIILGRMTKDPEVRYTSTQKCVASFTLAVDRAYKGADGEKEADFIPCVLWGKSAEMVGNSCQKGHRLLVEGRIQTRTYEGKDGQKRWVTEVVGDRMEFIERKNNSNAGEGFQPRQDAPQQQETQQNTPSSFDELGEECPF